MERCSVFIGGIKSQALPALGTAALAHLLWGLQRSTQESWAAGWRFYYLSFGVAVNAHDRYTIV